MLRFSFFGIPIHIHWMFWLLLAFLGGGYQLLENPNAESLSFLTLFVGAAAVSIVIHELGHALTGLCFGAPAAEIQLYGMGGMASFPGARFSRMQLILMTAAGPGASLLLAGLAFLVINFVVGPKEPVTMGDLFLQYFLGTMLWINLFWTVVNIMPILPLDGGQIIAAVLGPKRIRLTCIISFVTIGLLGVGLWWATRSIFNVLIMALLARHTWIIWKATALR